MKPQIAENKVFMSTMAIVCSVFVWIIAAQGHGTPTDNSSTVSQEREGNPEPALPQVPAPLPEISPVGRREPIAGDELQILLKNGDRLEGEFVSGDEHRLTLSITGVMLNIDRSTIEKQAILAPPAERYLKMRAQIADDDADRLVMLAEWLQRRRMYREALAELDTALKADRTHAEGLRMKRVVEQLAVLAERKGSGERAEEEKARQIDEAKRFPTRPKVNEFPLLTPEQINIIKVYEVDLRDPPKMTIPRETIQKMIVRFGDDPLIPESRESREAFFTKPPEEVLDTMFRLRARDMYDQVTVIGQPRSMRLFRDHVHAGWLVTSCASTACHGGSEAGRLQLFNYRPTADASVYTNFIILDRFETRDGSHLIDSEEPERSLLLQMGLPRDDARTPHPRIPGWQPAFRNREARRYLQTVEWIRSLYRPRPEYPVEYEPPGERPPADGAPAPNEPIER